MEDFRPLFEEEYKKVEQELLDMEFELFEEFHREIAEEMYRKCIENV